MNCPHCNNLIDESYHYCPKCGYNLKVFFADDNALFEAGQKLLRSGTKAFNSMPI